MSREQAIERAQRIREVLLDHGVPEVSIELQTGRRGPTDWNGLDPVAVMSHHIASRPTAGNPTPGLALVKRGRSDLPGPLANGTAGVDLVYRIICLGWANHPGYGGPWTVSGPCGTYTIPKDNARGYAWGTEFEGGYDDAVWDRVYTNRRTRMSMSFREFMGRANAGLAEAIWLPGVSSRGRYAIASKAAPGALAGYHGEHKTWAPGRKPDRRNYSTESGRAELRRFDTRPAPVPPATPQPDGGPTRVTRARDEIGVALAALARAGQLLAEVPADRKVVAVERKNVATATAQLRAARKRLPKR